MSANNIYLFGSAGTNELTTAAYLADAQRASGNQPGVARSQLVNKALHQVSTIAAGVGQFIADRSTTDVVDTLTAQNIADLLTAAFTPAPVGSMRRLKASLDTTGNSVAFTADQIVLATALGGRTILLNSFNKTLNVGGTGLNGMDTGTVTNNGYIGVYAIYNPTTGVSGVLATNATAAVVPEIYGGANMPAGFTFSALISVLLTVTAGISPFIQQDRSIEQQAVLVFDQATINASPTSFTVSTLPRNAVAVKAVFRYTSNAASAGGVGLSGSASGAGAATTNFGVGANVVASCPSGEVLMTTPQTLWNTTSNAAGTPTFQIRTIGYRF
jgi:hypothetical protein